MERRYALLEEVYIQMIELRGCLDPEGETEGETEDGRQLLTWEELHSELEAVAGVTENSAQNTDPS